MVEPVSIVHSVIFPVLAVVATALLGVLSWLGARLHTKVDQIPTELEKINRTLHQIEVDLRRELAHHDARLSVLETKIEPLHRKSQ
jgi:cell division protein FtsB